MCQTIQGRMSIFPDTLQGITHFLAHKDRSPETDSNKPVSLDQKSVICEKKRYNDEHVETGDKSSTAEFSFKSDSADLCCNNVPTIATASLHQSLLAIAPGNQIDSWQPNSIKSFENLGHEFDFKSDSVSSDDARPTDTIPNSKSNRTSTIRSQQQTFAENHQELPTGKDFGAHLKSVPLGNSSPSIKTASRGK